MDGNIVDTKLYVGYVLTKDLPNDILSQLAFKLAPADRVRLGTFLRFEDKIAFAVGRLLVRTLLTQFAPEPRGGWNIEVRGSGKPALLHNEQSPDLRFNITHCSGLVAAVVAVGRNVGIDAERLSDIIDHLEIAKIHLPAIELTYIESLDPARRKDAFFGLWTLREAYLKATGVGLTTQSSEVSFTLNPPAMYSSSLHTKELSQWFFFQKRLTKAHILSVAAQHHSNEHLVCLPNLIELEDLYL